MKKIHNILIIFLAASLLFACEDMEREPVIMPGDSPALSQPASGSQMVFQKANAAEQTINFAWTKADFGFPSATVYNLLVDAAGNNFANAIELASTSELSVSITHATLNERLMIQGMQANEPIAIEFRIEATVNPKYSLYSQPVNMTVTLYAASFPPIYMIGASVGGWDTSKAVEVASTGEPFEYITIWRFDASNGSNFRFFNQPEWSASLGGYDVFTSYPEDLLEPATGDDDPNFNFIGTAGWYEIKVNTEAGTIEMTATDEPGMYLTGDATHGWGWDEPVTALTYMSYKIWEGDVAFTQNGAFRLFAQKDWGPTSYGYDVVVNYDTDYIDVAEGHGDPNWSFLKPSGTYHVLVNLRTNTIEISEL